VTPLQLVAGLLTDALPVSGEATGQILEYSADISRTSSGVPHITAANVASLGFGAGYVQAEDNICLIAEKIVTVDATRSRYFGASDDNVLSDLFFQKAKEDRVVEQLLAGKSDGVHAPSPQARDLMRGFAAGYSNYLRKTGVANLTDPACSGRPWVRQIDALDMWRTNWANQVRHGSGALLDGIVGAAPPGPTAPGPTATGPGAAGTAESVAAVVATVDDAGLGSNADGLGRDATVNGTGMLLANPHFPWDGPDRFYRIHMKIPGVYDVEGAALIARSASGDRPQRDSGLEPHRFDRSAVRLAPADAGAR